MRKRNIAVLLLTVLLLAGLTGCARRGDTSGVAIVVGASEQFSDEDIRGAMDAAMRAFHRGHSGCAMVRLAYNEAYRTCWLAGARRVVHLITNALLVIINGYITVLSVQFIQSSWIKRMPITKLPSSAVSTALVIGFGLMTIYSLVFFVKDLKRSSSLDGEVDA